MYNFWQFEKDREHIPTAIECYTEELKVSEQEVISELKSRVESSWKDINEAFLKPTKFPTPIFYRILNLSRVIEVMYKKGDWYTHVGPEMQTIVKQILIDPIP